MTDRHSPRPRPLRLETLELRDVPAAALFGETLDGVPSSALPATWDQWSSDAVSEFRTTADQLTTTGRSTTASRAWVTTPAGADVTVEATVVADSLAPAGVFVRGAGLGSDSPTYYAATVVRGVEARLWRVVQGKAALIGSVASDSWLSGESVGVSLSAQGSNLDLRITRVGTGEQLTATGQWTIGPAVAVSTTDATITAAGFVGVARAPGYAGQVTLDDFSVSTAPTDPPVPPPTKPTPTTPTTPVVDQATPPRANPSRPAVPRSFDHIRVANLAYSNTPFGDVERQLLKSGVDLVIPNVKFHDEIAAVSPDTPQFVYTNLSNLYLGLLTDWNAYADRNGFDREAAFYHVKAETPFNGGSPSSVPVDQFWGVYSGSDKAGWTDQTRLSRTPGSTFALGGKNEAVAFGHLEKFRELNVDVLTGGKRGWQGTLEYVAAVDADGKPTAWKTLPILADGTGGFARDGRITFDPPKDWVAASVGDSARFFYVRVSSTGGGSAPVVRTVLGRDYTVAGTIPAFDYAADRDGDGYLNDAEFAGREAGLNARFAYEGRLFYPYYGENRFATNVASLEFRSWAADYHARTAADFPRASGFFVDNSIGRLAVDPTTVHERLDGYATDYGSLLGLVNKRLAMTGHWLIANTSGGGATAEPIIRNGVSYLEEFGLRPMSANTVQFRDLANAIENRRALSGGRAFEILDSLPSNGFDANDPRTQLATLAMYYMVADPDLSFLMINGGNEPSSGWERHWIDAIRFDVGRPAETWSVAATGADPSNARLTYEVYQRGYDNALVMYKPLAYTRGETGTTANNTTTTHMLDGWYRPVNADGSLGSMVNRVKLRNGEGMILAKV